MRNTRFPDETMSEALDRVGTALDRWHENFLLRRHELEEPPDGDKATLGRPTYS